MTTERWLPVIGWEGLYSVSDHGRVRSEPRDNCGGRRGRARRPAAMRRPTPNSCGMPFVTLTLGGRRRRASVSVLVWEAFVGPVPRDRMVRTRDGRPADGRLHDLCIVTRRFGRPVGVDSALRGRKIATPEVAKILDRLENGEKGSVIAKEYGVSKVAISAIRTGRRRVAAVPAL